jgi:hypothetical protein
LEKKCPVSARQVLDGVSALRARFMATKRKQTKANEHAGLIISRWRWLMAS